MKSIVHISDLHFGQEDPIVADALVRDICDIAPLFVAVSGDITQREGASSFQKRGRFWKGSPARNLSSRVTTTFRCIRSASAFARFQGALFPIAIREFQSDEISAIGINSVSRFHYQKGRVSFGECERLGTLAHERRRTKLTIVVMHHPWNLRDESPRLRKAVESAHVDLILTGHRHHSSICELGPVRSGAYRTFVVEAGTATSTRLRAEGNAYNVIHFDEAQVRVSTRVWNGMGFEPRGTIQSLRGDSNMGLERVV